MAEVAYWSCLATLIISSWAMGWIARKDYTEAKQTRQENDEFEC